MTAPHSTNDAAEPSSLGLWALLLVTIFAWAPATYPGYWQTSVGFAPVFNARYPAPIADIATVADLWRGTGSAAFVLTRPLTAIGLSPLIAVRIALVVTIVAGAVGIYSWLRPRFGDRAAGLAGAVYGLMPPLLMTVYVRGSLADALVLAMVPLALAGLTAYRLSRSPAFVGGSVVALIWIWRTQAGLAVIVTVLLLLYAWLVERDRLATLAVAVAGIAGLVSLVPLWTIQAPPAALSTAKGLRLFELLSPLPGRGQPVRLGFAALAFSIVAAWLLWMQRRRRQTGASALPPVLLLGDQFRLILFAFGAWIVAALLSLSIVVPLWQLTGLDRLLSDSWQVLLPVLPFLAASAGSLPLLAPALARPAVWASLLALVVLAAFPYLSPDFTTYRPPEQPVAAFGEPVTLVLLEARVESSAAGESAAGRADLSLVWQPLQPLPFDYNLFFQALEADDAGDGYEVVAQIDRQPLPDRPATVWQPGEILTATLELDLPLDPTQANLRYYVGFYDWRDGSRLPLSSGVDDKVILYGE